MIVNSSQVINSYRSIRIKLSNNERLLFFTGFTTFCIQGTDIKLGFVKLSELILLIYFVFISYKLSKGSTILLYIFIFFLFSSIIISSFTTFYLPSEAIGGLKQPYLISISRFLELIACLGFVEYVRREMQVLTEIGFSIKRIFDYLVLANCLLGVIYFCDLLAILLKIYSIESSPFFYDNLRLKGVFAEGGPNGLCLAFLLCITLQYCSRLIRIVGFCCFITLIFLAQSKAAIMMLLIFASIKIYKKINLRLIFAFPILIVGLIIVFYMSSLVLDSYLQSLSNLDTLLISNRDDPSFTMGRVAGLYIVPNIIINNFWFGIGLGNYALTRNNPLYSGLFPDVDLWDSPGLGGLVDLFLETGFLGFVCFIGVLIYIYRALPLSYTSKIHIAACFILPYICGVQLYFQYPWFALGFALCIQRDNSL